MAGLTNQVIMSSVYVRCQSLLFRRRFSRVTDHTADHRRAQTTTTAAVDRSRMDKTDFWTERFKGIERVLHNVRRERRGRGETSVTSCLPVVAAALLLYRRAVHTCTYRCGASIVLRYTDDVVPGGMLLLGVVLETNNRSLSSY